MQYGENRSYRGSRLVNEFVLRFLSFNLNDTFKTWSRCSTSSSSSSSSPTVSDTNTREREDRIESDISPVTVSSSNVDDRTEQRVVGRDSNHEPVHQANPKFPKTKIGDHDRTVQPVVCRLRSRKF